MKRKPLILFALILFVAAAATAQDPAAYRFLRLDAGARASAMNGSFVSMKDDPTILFYNPAGLGTITGPALSFGYMKHLMDVRGGAFALATELEGIGSIGIGAIYLHYGSFTERDEFFNSLGAFSAFDLALMGGTSFELDERTSVGVSLKGIFSQIANYRSAAAALDIGLFHSFDNDRTTAGVSILNLGRQLNAYKQRREGLPLDMKAGIMHVPEGLPAHVNVNMHHLLDDESLGEKLKNFSVGVEFLPSDVVRLRVGYNNAQRRELKLGTSSGLAGFSAGGGVISGRYSFDYAFNSYGNIGGLHRVSLGLRY